MKIIKEDFERYAAEQGYEDGAELFDYLGGNQRTYARFEKEVPINKGILTRICWEIGISSASEFLKYEDGDSTRYQDILEEF